jgi:hypothetical protein
VLGFALVNPNQHKTLIGVGWVEERNPTFSVGLYPTYPNSGFFIQALIRKPGKKNAWSQPLYCGPEPINTRTCESTLSKKP